MLTTAITIAPFLFAAPRQSWTLRCRCQTDRRHGPDEQLLIDSSWLISAQPSQQRCIGWSEWTIMSASEHPHRALHFRLQQPSPIMCPVLSTRVKKCNCASSHLRLRTRCSDILTPNVLTSHAPKCLNPTIKTILFIFIVSTVHVCFVYQLDEH